MKYGTIVADPPWDYVELFRPNTTKQRNVRGLAPYPVMKLAEIRALPVSDWAASDAHLYVWTTNNFVAQAHETCRAWGFEPKGMLTWVKTQIGLGRYFRTTTEHVVFAVRGAYFAGAKNIPTHFIAPRQEHSQKPDELLSIAERMSRSPRLEMFARRRRDGWDVWGDQAPQVSQMALEVSA